MFKPLVCSDNTNNVFKYKAENYGGTTLYIRGTHSSNKAIEIRGEQLVPIEPGTYVFMAIATGTDAQLMDIQKKLAILENRLANKTDLATEIWQHPNRTLNKLYLNNQNRIYYVKIKTH